MILGNPKYKRIYISGPITGIVNDNKEQFEKYETKFRNLNFEVVNPLKLFTEQEVNDLRKQLENKQITDEEFWTIFMRRDITHLMTCDLIGMLPKWENSKGANVEFRTARDLYMPIIDAETLQELI